MTQRPIFQYILLALILLPAVWIQTGNTGQLIDLLQHATAMPAKPFEIKIATREIGSGPYYGYQLLALGGKAFHSPMDVEKKIKPMKPGQTIQVLLSSPDGLAMEREIKLQPMASGSLRFTTAALWITLDGVIPILALLLGAVAVAIRPKDMNAWLLLFLLLSFSEIARFHAWRGPLPNLTLFWSQMLGGLWPAFMMLFGLYFPYRLPSERKRPWVKFLILLPVVAVHLFLVVILTIWNYDINMAGTWRDAFLHLSKVQTLISMAAIMVFFVSIGSKSGQAATPDARRRLKILWVGSSAALTPMFFVAIYGLSTGTDFFEGVPVPLTVAVLLMLLLFPATLAYVIVIEKAMDLSFVIRQSLQYGLFKAGLWGVRFALVVTAGVLLARDGLAMGAQQKWWLVVVLLLLLAMRQGGTRRASEWIDKKFFREAYDSEHILADLALQAGQFLELGPLLDTVARRLGDTLHVPDITILLRQPAGFVTAWSSRQGEPLTLETENRIVPHLDGRAKPLEVSLSSPAPWLRGLDVTELQAIDIMRSEVLIALPGRRDITGILSLGPKLSEAPYTPTDLRLLQTVAAQVGLSIENSRLAASLAAEAAHRERLNREVEIAREVQQRLFPQSYPPVAGVDYSGFCRPALGVGGDYYDFLQLPNGSFGIAIGDVSGKGIAAALLMASLQASLRGQTIAGQHDLSILMKNVNKLVYDASSSNRYATFFYAEFNPVTRILRCSNGGHNAPMILRGEKEVLRLEADGPVVGLLPFATFEQSEMQLQPGDIFIAFTDGISEAMNPEDEEWEEERFLAAAQQCRHLPAAAMITDLFRNADAFARGAKQHDDMTLIVLKL